MKKDIIALIDFLLRIGLILTLMGNTIMMLRLEWIELWAVFVISPLIGSLLLTDFFVRFVSEIRANKHLKNTRRQIPCQKKNQ